MNRFKCYLSELCYDHKIMIESTWNLIRTFPEIEICTKRRMRESESGWASEQGDREMIFTLTHMLMHTAETNTIGRSGKINASTQEEQKWRKEAKKAYKKYLPLKNHFTSLSGIFVRPHDKTIDLFSMASTVSAAIVGVLVLNSSSSIASVCVCMVF